MIIGTTGSETFINMNADKFKFTIDGTNIISLRSLFQSDGTFNPDLISVSIRGIVETDGLIIYKRELQPSDS